jgi:CDP-glucose 4,6-dehydratase
LVPDLVRAVAAGSKLEIRSPDAIRPWQHVLESLAGYLLLGQKLLAGERDFATAWNFGPDSDDSCTVVDVLARMKAFWPQLSWRIGRETQPHEAQWLSLDSTKAREKLGWRCVWPLDTSIRVTSDWYGRFLDRGDAEINHSRTSMVGTVRGLHFQRPPRAEMKLVRCLKGRVLDVAIDLRAGSPAFLSWHAEELMPGNSRMLVIPEG